ncbi:hypothetical protein BO86DRAFT_406356 [Aspergillus japonicus CBS 114.51]|uniref:Zn(2)-C6 fungal-type domain-containing protein n=2 Tax=Aspergillus TaxID=5052 RepID=A0A2V5H4J3_ASPV1|nr:hypothetical protein BO86DRAFT_406356 [Aspergillus japonicus CBS 114.51]PYI18421.1 hypothetical protein BO99DRAFT_386507 [Aspergillus violaceofuscus CBS 115571]RAH85902.1 hypothetical protein BO86DRAFT_406356 [Aspergillus japonicus CBS 114.51]
MRHLVKKACDECIARKVKCSGARPCDACRQNPNPVKCTYLKPVRRRGPKVRRWSGPNPRTHAPIPAPDDAPPKDHTTVPLAALAYVVQLYRQSSYSVWPVLDAAALLEKLESTPPVDTLCLALALSAATMAQLQLSPLRMRHITVDCTIMAAECVRLRDASSCRERPDVRGILVSFFLHVYHAKINRRHTAMAFLQEAIAGARLLGLDAGCMARDADVVANQEVVFLLLWISERGYAMHLGRQPSYRRPVVIPHLDSEGNAEVKGLLELGRLFATFDGTCSGRGSASSLGSVECLAEAEAALAVPSPGQEGGPSTRLADYCITKEWMRTMIWQKALAQRLLSSTSCLELMTFRFPAVVGRSLLGSLQGFTESDLLPLGRDQLLKCFEVTNSLADTILLTGSSAVHSTLQWRPQDFLHALYQKLLPFLKQDPMLEALLRAKTAEALVKAPARLLGLGYGHNRRTGQILRRQTEESEEANMEGPLTTPRRIDSVI